MLYIIFIRLSYTAPAAVPPAEVAAPPAAVAAAVAEAVASVQREV